MASKEYKRKYYQEHKEQVKGYVKKYYQKHKEEIKKQKQKYFQENKEKIAKYYREYYQENKEKERKRNRKKYKKYINRGILVWENTYGEVPKGYCIIHKDNNKNNNNIDNLVMISKKELGTMYFNNLYVSSNKEITEANILLAKIKNKIRAIQGGHNE